MIDTVILVVVDCLRADHVGAYGYSRPTTPRLDRWAGQGVLWEQAHSTSCWTRPSVTSILTGLYPIEHGVHRGIRRATGDGQAAADAYLSARPTLAERFARAGWRCAALTDNAQLAPFCGLSRGFEPYEWNLRKADAKLAALSEWLRAEPRRPAFAYLHLMEAHWPYQPRRRHVALFGGDRDSMWFAEHSARDLGRLRREVSRGAASLSGGEVDQLVNAYDGAVRRLDGKLKRLEELLAHLGRLDRTALVLTADHGEEFMEHGGIGHGQTLYEELIRVPLIARFPDGPAGRRIPEPVSLVDLADTLLGAAGIHDEWSRTDLLAAEAPRRPVVAELLLRNRYLQTVQAGRWKLLRRYRLPASACPGGWRPPADPRELADLPARRKLFDLETDPTESLNRSRSPFVEAEMKQLNRLLDEWWVDACASPIRSAGAEVAVDPATVERLRDLGYLE
jgi:arylsulfatase A-like enzyme